MLVDRLRSRRSVLTAAVAAATATVFGALRRPLPVRAAGDDGTPIQIGALYADARSQTTLANGSNTERVLWVASNNGAGAGVALTGYSATSVGVEGWSGGVGPGVYGHAVGHGVHGESSYGTGVYGKATNSNQMGVHGESVGTGGTIGVRGWVSSSSGTGVEGFAGSFTGNTIGVHGYTASTSGKGVVGEASAAGSTFGVDGRSSGPESVGVRGWATGGTGVLGFSGSPPSPVTKAKTGVFGEAAQDSASRGVWGKSAAGRGVFGEATTGYGVRGYATSGSALYGAAPSGYALRTSGRLRFDKVSGVATINAGATRSALITPGTNIGSSSYVLLTPQSDPGSRRFWATLDTAADTLRIRTNTSSASPIRIAWLLVQ